MFYDIRLCVSIRNKLFLQSNIDQVPRTCALTFHSSLNIKEIVFVHKARVYSGILFHKTCFSGRHKNSYSPSYLLFLPKMIVAIVTDELRDNEMIEEGRRLARNCSGVFVSTNDSDWTSSEAGNKFFLQCWGSRFTSWSNQVMPEEVVSRQREKRQARALPSRPDSDRDLSFSLPIPPRERHSIGAFLDEKSPPLTPLTPLTPHSSTTLPRSPRFRPSIPSSAPVVQDSGIYSDPIAMDIGIKQMKAATLDRKKSSTTDPGYTPYPVISPDLPDSPFPEGDYASVEDTMRNSSSAINMFNTLERQRRSLQRTPSTSPPPVPLSPTDTEISILNGGSDEDETNDLYATVQTTTRHVPTKSGGANRGYDHLEASPEILRKKPPSYDHLNPPPVPARTDSLSGKPPTPSHPKHPTQSIPPRATFPEEMYATVDVTAKKARRAPPPIHDRHKPENDNVGVEALYSTVKKPPPKKPKPPRRAATPEEPVYSLPDKTRILKGSPPVPLRSPVCSPPPVAPKPTRKSPTPPLGRYPRISKKAESFDAGYQKEPLLADLKKGRSFSIDKRMNPSPVVPHREHSCNNSYKTTSLPKNYRTALLENGHALTHSLEYSPTQTTPTLPARFYEATDLGLDDEAPPLPPRNYNWSDIEDNDDELFQSEDELDDHQWTVSDQQKLYATITRATQNSDNTSGVEAIYDVVNKMVLLEEGPSNEVQVARQSSMSHEEESAYDTLENVLKSIRTEAHTPYPATPTVTQPRVNTPPHPSKIAMPTLSRPSPPSESQAQGLKSTTFTTAEIKNLQKTQKLLKRLEKQAQKEAARRQQQEAKKKKREEEERRRKEGKKKPKKGKKQPERTRYFGSPLASVADEGGVPVFVRKCVEFVEREGLKAEGIYRVPGKKEHVLLLQDKFEEDHNLDIGSLGMFESAVSSTLKAYFKLLPDPLISENVAAQLLVINSLDIDSQKTRIHELLSYLPRENLKTLKFMMEHLHRIQEEHEVNKMTPSNLSIVFWPTLMRPPLTDLADSTKRLGWQLIMTRIIERPDFVPCVD